MSKVINLHEKDAHKILEKTFDDALPVRNAVVRTMKITSSNKRNCSKIFSETKEIIILFFVVANDNTLKYSTCSKQSSEVYFLCHEYPWAAHILASILSFKKLHNPQFVVEQILLIIRNDLIAKILIQAIPLFLLLYLMIC